MPATSLPPRMYPGVTPVMRPICRFSFLARVTNVTRLTDLTPLLLWRRHVGAGLLETIFPTVDKLPGPDKDPLTHRRHAECLHVEVGDVAPASRDSRQLADRGEFVAPRPDAPAAPRRAQHQRVLRRRAGNPESKRNHPTPVQDLQISHRVGLDQVTQEKDGGFCAECPSENIFASTFSIALYYPVLASGTPPPGASCHQHKSFSLHPPGWA